MQGFEEKVDPPMSGRTVNGELAESIVTHIKCGKLAKAMIPTLFTLILARVIAFVRRYQCPFSIASNIQIYFIACTVTGNMTSRPRYFSLF